jgi:hypothetical protein
MTYTINGKEWTEFDINLRCAELLGFKASKEQYMHYGDRDENVVLIARARDSYGVNYCNVWNDASHIIDKCFHELMKLTETFDDGIADGLCTRWEYLMDYDKCTKLVAACICYIELNEAAL